MKFSKILFDLDGVLTDPKEGIINSVQFALSKLGIEGGDAQELEKFIGPPLQDSFREFYGLSKEKTEEALRYYRSYFSEKGMFENVLYDGISELLQELQMSHCTIALASSKPTVFCEKIVEHFSLASFFDFVAGSTLDGSRKTKADVIAFALENLSLNSEDSIVMIGDRKHDVIGAQQRGLASIGVTYGYGSFEELQAAGADTIVHSVDGLRSFLLLQE